MKWRFRKSKKILPGVKLNITNKGISANIGIKGANVHLGKKGAHLNLGIPDTGISSRTKIGGQSAEQNDQNATTYTYSCPVCDTQVDPYSVKFCPSCGGKFAEGQPLLPSGFVNGSFQTQKSGGWKVLAIITGVILSIGMLIVAIFITGSISRSNQNAATVASNVASDAMAKRRGMAIEAQLDMTKKYPDAKAETSGNLEQILILTNTAITNEFANAYRIKSAAFINQCKQAGFTEIVLDNKKKKWNISL
jgi:type II secretory pathway pseudopilin PulG